jgi:hypothetical protein
MSDMNTTYCKVWVEPDGTWVAGPSRRTADAATAELARTLVPPPPVSASGLRLGLFRVDWLIAGAVRHRFQTTLLEWCV